MSETLQYALAQQGLTGAVRFSPEQITTLAQLTNYEDAALAHALLAIAQQRAQAPVSNFFVAAIAIADSGYWYLGANLEIADQPLTQSLHAEQSAIGHAALFAEQHIDRLIISASPCGHCRQFLHELKQEQLRIELPDAHFMLDELLPHAFGPADLHQAYGMLNALQDQLTTPPLTQLAAAQHELHDKLLLAALGEANASYAPYSQNRAGVALQLKDGGIIRGRYLENAAFNPSVGPMQLALSQLFLQGYQPQDICRGIMVETPSGIQQSHTAASLLSSVSPINLEIVHGYDNKAERN